MFGNPEQIAAAMRQFADMLSAPAASGPVNWDMAKNIARHAVVAEGDPSVMEGERRQVVEALNLADLWLNQATALPSGVTTAEAWSRSEWIEKTIQVWQKLCDPIAARMVDTMGGTLGSAGLPAEAQAMAGPLMGMLKQMGGMMVGSQMGQALGTLAREVVGSSDIGLPLSDTAALLPGGIAAFSQGLEIPSDEIRLYLALREAAHHRLFQHVPWLRAHLLGAVEEYARGITVDVSALEEQLRGLDMNNLEQLQQALSGGALLKPEETERQKAALARLETMLALVEGWVATVVDAAAEGKLPAAAALAETVRRRRASGGPAERTFGTLVGLELRPRRLREAAALWKALGDARGVDARDAVWGHPDLMPTADDLDSPESFVSGGPAFDLSDLEFPGEGDGEKDGGPGDDTR
ncbi:putative hydrolase [Thermocatellispora tengchongensis]|uniref:Putative hydrolase n=1 Tax=Thermocatellispora tengchongensis TaxID=1073253 RepID=A0A840P391_9ACTN|nr:zinc-dependent metalloprotease [Thermocatellispora tengchongensis]MBB5133842.1 putative hydrolase [Thermocatellispora tengchongensis]